MRHLILANGNHIRFVNQNVGGLEHGIAQKPVGSQIFILDILSLLFVGGNPLQPAQRRDHGKQQM